MQVELVFLLYVIFNMAVLWFVKNWYDGDGELDNVITKNADLDKKLNLQLDELQAEAMQ